MMASKARDLREASEIRVPDVALEDKQRLGPDLGVLW